MEYVVSSAATPSRRSPAGRSPANKSPSSARINSSFRLTLLIAIFIALGASWRLQRFLYVRQRCSAAAVAVQRPPPSPEFEALSGQLKALQLEEEQLVQRVRGLQSQAFREKWEHTPPRPKILAFVGIMSGFNSDHLGWGKSGDGWKSEYRLRRETLRATWAPTNRSEMERIESETGVVVRFVAGHSTNPAAEAEMDEEEWRFGGFLRLPIIEDYYTLNQKTLTYFTTVVSLYDVKYIFKTDDDVFLRLDRIPYIAPHWDQIGADYLGCMKTGRVNSEYWSRWYEPMHKYTGQNYFVHAYGSDYVISGRAAERLAGMPPGFLRFFASEDVTVGAWMMAMNMTHWDEQRLCSDGCKYSALGVWDNNAAVGRVCAGLCNPIPSLWWLWGQPACHLPPESLRFYGNYWGPLTNINASEWEKVVVERERQEAEDKTREAAWDDWQRVLDHWQE